MPLFDRHGATAVIQLGTLRRTMPLMLPERMDALLLFDHDLEIEHTLDWIAAHNARGSGPKLTLFHVVMAAIVRTLGERPRMNRFIKGGKVWKNRLGE